MKHPLCLLALSALLPTIGCTTFDNLEDACDENVAGGASLDAVELDALLRLNCYRKLAGVSKASANELVQTAAKGTVNYVLQNPNIPELFGDFGAAYWLSQDSAKPGFTGTSLFERLTGDPLLGGAGYAFGAAGLDTWEFIYIDLSFGERELPSGAVAIDDLMRSPVFRQIGLQPSYIDGAYAEVDLPSQWFTDGGWTLGPPPTGRVYYMSVLYQAPHFEHVDRPVLLPKPDQVGVPLYSWSQDRTVVNDEGFYPTIQIGYPITLLMGAINPDNYKDVDQNQYAAYITGFEIAGPDGRVGGDVVHPGDLARDVYPDGRFLRTTLGIFPPEPLEPNSLYEVLIDYESPEGQFQIDYSFTTAKKDPGLDELLFARQAPSRSLPSRVIGMQMPNRPGPKAFQGTGLPWARQPGLLP